MILKPIINTIINLFKRKSPYVILSKEIGLNPNSGRIFPEQLSLVEASKIDIVVIGKKNKPNLQKIITTFRDEKNNIIERLFEYKGYDKPSIRKIYKKIEGCSSAVKGRLVQIFEDLNSKGDYRVWQKVGTEKQFLIEFKNKVCGLDKVKVLSKASVITKERTINDVKTEVHSFSNYYKSADGQKLEPKMLVLNIEKDVNGVPVIKSTSAYNCYVPMEDEYLAFRAYDNEDIKKNLAKYVIKKFGMEDLNIKIERIYTKKNKDIAAFNWRKGIVEFFNDNQDKIQSVNTIFHEIQHALQYTIMGVWGKFDSKYGKSCEKLYKCEKTRFLKQLADKYFVAHTNYVSPSENFEAYYNNMLEEEARRIAKIYLADYLQKGKKLCWEFHIPRNEL